MDASRLVGCAGAIGNTTFSDAFRASISGQTGIVANANTHIDPGLVQGGRFSPEADRMQLVARFARVDGTPG